MEILEGKPTLTYPQAYTFKVMGKQEHGFKEYVRQLFHRVLAQEISQDSMSELPSKGARYLSVSVTVVLISEEQRTRVYEALHKDRRILYYL
ncbi:MAG: YbeD family protein [Myxococcaceae bacterium]